MYTSTYNWIKSSRDMVHFPTFNTRFTGSQGAANADTRLEMCSTYSKTALNWPTLDSNTSVSMMNNRKPNRNDGINTSSGAPDLSDASGFSLVSVPKKGFLWPWKYLSFRSPTTQEYSSIFIAKELSDFGVHSKLCICEIHAPDSSCFYITLCFSKN